MIEPALFIGKKSGDRMHGDDAPAHLIRNKNEATGKLWQQFDQGGGFWHYAKLIGVLPLLTAAMGTCPLYSVLGKSTCPTKH